MSFDLVELNIFRKKVADLLKSDPFISRRKIAQLLNCSPSKAQRAMTFIKNNWGDKVFEQDIKKEIEKEFSSDFCKINTKSLNITCVEDAIEAAKINLDIWDIIKAKVKTSEVTMKLRNYDKSGKPLNDEPKTFTMYHISIDLKKKEIIIDYPKLKKELIEEIKEYIKPIPQYSFNINKEHNNLYFISLCDIHLGRQSWAEETGFNYDSKTAISNFNESLYSLIDKSQGFKFSEILFVVGNDLYNFDRVYPFPQTERGTPADSDSRWQKMFRMGRILMMNAIHTLSGLAPVRVVIIPGNHDNQTVFYLGELLYTIYENNENINVDNLAKRRKYYKYGQNLIGMSHGHLEKLNDLHAVMSAEAREYWGQTKYKYYYMGHKHHEKQVNIKVKERYQGLRTQFDINEDYKGVLVDYLPNLAYNDDYETDHSFIGTIRAAKACVHNMKGGRIATFIHNL